MISRAFTYIVLLEYHLFSIEKFVHEYFSGSHYVTHAKYNILNIIMVFKYNLNLSHYDDVSVNIYINVSSVYIVKSYIPSSMRKYILLVLDLSYGQINNNFQIYRCTEN